MRPGGTITGGYPYTTGSTVPSNDETTEADGWNKSRQPLGRDEMIPFGREPFCAFFADYGYLPTGDNDVRDREWRSVR